MRRPWTEENRRDAAALKARLQQGPANRHELAAVVQDPIRFFMGIGCLAETEALEADPPFDQKEERGTPRRYWLKDAAAS